MKKNPNPLVYSTMYGTLNSKAEKTCEKNKLCDNVQTDVFKPKTANFTFGKEMHIKFKKKNFKLKTKKE